MKARFFSAVLAAMMLATASVGITASAEEAATEGASAVEDIDDIPEDDSAELKDDETDISAEDTSSVCCQRSCRKHSSQKNAECGHKSYACCQRKNKFILDSFSKRKNFHLSLKSYVHTYPTKF